jgi:hypothetical protein
MAPRTALAERLLNNDRLKTPGGFTIRRFQAVMHKGRVTYTPQDIHAEGIVVPSGNLGMVRTGEAEQQGDGITVYTETPINTGSGDTGQPADVIIWHDQAWQVTGQDDYTDFGFNVVQCTLAEAGGRASV